MTKEEEQNISQSLLKMLTKYADKKECGLKLKAQYIDRLSDKPTEAQALGNWFEYVCTGALPPYNPVIPEPKLLKSGELPTAYKRMEEQVNNYKFAVEHYKIEIIKAGYDMKYGNITGTADILAEMNGRKVLIDIKTTGLYDDKWSDFGWNTEHLAEGYRPKFDILIQALHYKWLYRQITGEDIDFYFWVFSTKNTNDFKIIKVNIDEALFTEHAKDIQTGLRFLLHSLKHGFKAHPSMSRCGKCFLKETCVSKLEVPSIDEVYYGIGLGNEKLD